MSRVQFFFAKFRQLNFWQFVLICNFDFVFFWLGTWCESLRWVIMGRRSSSFRFSLIDLLPYFIMSTFCIMVSFVIQSVSAVSSMIDMLSHACQVTLGISGSPIENHLDPGNTQGNSTGMLLYNECQLTEFVWSYTVTYHGDYSGTFSVHTSHCNSFQGYQYPIPVWTTWRDTRIVELDFE